MPTHRDLSNNITSFHSNKIKILSALFVWWIAYGSLHAQTYILKGTVYDADDKTLTLPLAHIVPTCEKTKGTASDDNGKYYLELQSRECEVKFLFIGYQTQTKYISFKGSNIITLDIYLQAENRMLSEVKVTEKRYEMKKDESTSSVSYVSQRKIEESNVTTLDNAFDQVGGLIVVDNEPQMRGGSGFSSGLGSRVMIMMDEMPVLRVDAGRPAWNLIPMENIEQIEVLKGAASVLYGSSAITGAINVRTAYPKGKPTSKAVLYNGFYSRPFVDYRCSWPKGSIPLTYGANLSHARKIKKIDLVLSAEYAKDEGFVGQELSVDSTLKNPDAYDKIVKEERMRFNVGTRYRIKDNMFVGINGNLLYSHHHMTHFWLNADSGMYRTYPGSLTEIKDLMFFVDPYFKYYAKNESSHSLKTRFMYSDNWATNNQDSKSEMYYLDYQYAKKFKKAGDLQLFAGVVGQFARSKGNVFSGIRKDSSEALKPKYSTNAAIYTQLEKRFLKKKNLILLGGARYEYFQIFETFGHFTKDTASGNYVEAKPVFRVGLNYNLVESYTYIRTSFGMGYRFPSIGERYLTTKVGNYGFYPNPDLKSETSWNVELGVQQMFKLFNFKGFIDVAGYYQRYNNYVEFFLGPWLTREQELNPLKRYGFKFFNTGPARIAGVDLSVGGEGKMGKQVKYTLLINYAYTNPKVLDTGYVFTETATKAYTYNNTSSDTNGRIMKYRIEHILKADLDFTFYGRFNVGVSTQFFSLMKNVDKFFYELDRYSSIAPRNVRNANSPFPFDGLENYRLQHDNGTWVFALRAGVEVSNVKVSIIVNNLFNKEYSLRPMCPEPPRLTILQLVYKYNEGEVFFPRKKNQT
ncbi:MAG: TonB-dependent receptor [Bacteroidales bacterium]|nr:TonB-dependent receptor [Bacteroidales bacterium]MDD2688181.1 TonB-dependent receptor [Bacteroidales bacterium]MDD3330617.1 TonB-dependent receptor [Bacteroidales bacterium]MDD4044600.1 TonB-dependent receptor [Bacteroidales bacterium]MDD4581659.1 TonB-dependent receptor [Bacteroidales bacterium]